LHLQRYAHQPHKPTKASFAPLLQRAGLATMTFDQLRHTVATILLLKNVSPNVVSEMLGHATIAITLDTYSHVLPNMQHSAVAAMEETFFVAHWCSGGRWVARGPQHFPRFAGLLGVEPRRFEPLTSAFARRIHTVVVVYQGSKIPANKHILS
jgi:hypothetical protein